MSDVTHYARARQRAEAVGDTAERPGIEAQLAISTALREIDRTIRNGFKEVVDALDELGSAIAAGMDGAK